MVTCAELTDYWDQAIGRFLVGGRAVTPDPRMRSWFEAYRGRGRGAVDLDALPEPYLGVLDHRPVGVFLGLNPGEAHLGFQGRSGLFADEIRQHGTYSRGRRPGHTCGTHGSRRWALTATSSPAWPSCGAGPGSQA